FTQAAHNRKIDPRSVRKQIASAFYKDPSGRIRARGADRFRQTLHIPTSKPEVRIQVPTKSSGERKLVGRWMNALNTAGRGDFSKLKELPRNQLVGVECPAN